MFDSQPKITLTKTKNERLLEIASYVLIAFQIIYIIINYSDLPEKVPGHFDLDGTVNRFDDKSSVWLMPLIALGLTTFIFWLNKNPHWFNYINKITEENAEKNYRSAVNFGRFLILAINLMFAIVSFNIIRIANTPEVGFHPFSNFLLIAILVCITIIPIVLVVKQAYQLFSK